MNATNPKIWEELENILTDCEKEPSIRVILLKGNERAFVAGAGVGNMVKTDIREAFHITDITMRVQEKLADFPKHCIAVISGYALAEQPTLALPAAKAAIYKGLDVGLKDGLNIEQQSICMLFGTEDRKEGIAAFMEKRKPKFQGGSIHSA
jgi:enoyl-CoA hydratase/carnithine racemase